MKEQIFQSGKRRRQRVGGGNQKDGQEYDARRFWKQFLRSIHVLPKISKAENRRVINRRKSFSVNRYLANSAIYCRIELHKVQLQ